MPVPHPAKSVGPGVPTSRNGQKGGALSAVPTGARSEYADNPRIQRRLSRPDALIIIRDHDGKFPALFDSVLADAGVRVVFSGIRIPRMNAIMERWICSCRRELLDRTLIWNQRHLLHALREYEHFYNTHRPHQGIANARPVQPLPQPTTDQAAVTRLDIRRRQRLGGILNEYHHAA